MTETEKDFYARIGLVATRFAKLEHVIQQMIHLLINADDEFISQLVIQKNAAKANEDLLIDLATCREIEVKAIKDFLTTVRKVRLDRNVFVHGDWDVLRNESDALVFICSTPKVSFRKVEAGIMTVQNTHDEFTLTDLQNVADSIQECIKEGDGILARMEFEEI